MKLVRQVLPAQHGSAKKPQLAQRPSKQMKGSTQGSSAQHGCVRSPQGSHAPSRQMAFGPQGAEQRPSDWQVVHGAQLRASQAQAPSA
jgi:hypothetical protein